MSRLKNPLPSRPALEKASWIAGVVGVALTLGFGLYQAFQTNSTSSTTVSGNTGPVVLAQGSPGSTLIVNIPPPRQHSDQDNCQEEERWLGMKPYTVHWDGKVPKEQFQSAKFHGQIRWSTVIGGKRTTTRGTVHIQVDGQKTLLHTWDSPATEIYDIEVPVSHLFDGTTGSFRIIWRYTGGSSGVCISESRIEA